MGIYLAGRIIAVKYTYDYVISKKPALKAAIDAELTKQERTDLITQ